MSRIVDYGAEEVCQVMEYNNGNPFVGKAPLLPAAYIDFSTLNGDNDTLIFFKNEPPLLKMAQIKKQLISFARRQKYQNSRSHQQENVTYEGC